MKVPGTVLSLSLFASAHADTFVYRAGDPNGATTDTWLAGIAPSTDYSAAELLEWDGNDGGGMNFALVRFDEVFGDAPGQITADDVVTSARLDYFVEDPGDAGLVTESRVAWDNGVTYDTFGGDPGVQADETGPVLETMSGGSGWQSVDVTPSITAWAADPGANRGWVIRPTSSGGVEIASSEASYPLRVRLTVVVNEDPPEAPLVFRAGGTYGATSDTWIGGATPGVDHSSEIVVEWDASDGGSPSYGLVRFDALFGGAEGQIDAADQVTSATLEYMVVSTGNSGLVHEVLVDWEEGVTWNTFGGDPGVQPDEYGPQLTVAPGNDGWGAVNVQRSIAAWALDPAANRGWIIRPTGSDGVSFVSSEGERTSRVKLTVVLNAGEPPPAHVVRGPYLQQATPDALVVRWRTDVPTDARVIYGLSPDDLTLTATNASVVNDHEVALSGLAPDTVYYYAVGTVDFVLAGGDADHFFRTGPAPDTDRPARLWVIGDAGTANSDAALVYNAYRAVTGTAYTDLWLMLGDNAYEDGTDAEYQAAVFDMYPELLRQTPLWPTLGNHDGHSADSDTETGPYYDIFTLPRLGEAGGLPSGTEAYYSFDYGNVHFICLDSYDTDTSPGGAMMTWLADDLADTLADWIIAFWHHPPYTKGSHDSDTESQLIDMRERALPILEAGGVDLVLCGHSHSYERSFLLDGHYGTSDTLTDDMIVNGGDGREAGDGAYDKTGGRHHAGAVYAVAGSSGKTSNGPLDHPAMFVSLEELGSMILEIDGGRLEATFLRCDETIGDTFTLVRRVECPADLDGSGAADFGDILAVLTAWGADGGREDLDEDGTVGFGDLLLVLSAWGACA